MAEFCLDCWNRMNNTNYTEADVTLEEDLCEGCGEVKPCIVALEPPGFFARLWDFFLQLIGLTPNLP